MMRAFQWTRGFDFSIIPDTIETDYRSHFMIHIIYSSEEGKYLLLDFYNNVVGKAETHEEATMLADAHEAVDEGFCWIDQVIFA